VNCESEILQKKYISESNTVRPFLTVEVEVAVQLLYRYLYKKLHTFASTLVLKTKGSGLGPTLHPAPILTVVVEIAVQKVAQHAKIEKFISWSTDSSRLHKKKLVCKNCVSNSNCTYVRS
jgi:hypothetical protein